MNFKLYVLLVCCFSCLLQSHFNYTQSEDIFSNNYFYKSPSLIQKPIVVPKRFKRKKNKNPVYCYKPIIDEFFKDLVKDVFNLNWNLLCWDSFKIIVTVFPFYISTRMIDDKLHRCFYDEMVHKNRTQLPTWCHTA